MIDTWQEITLGDLLDEGFAEIRTGPFGTQLRASDYSDHGVPVLNVRNLGFGTLRQAEIERVGSEVQARLSGHLLKENDLVFGRKGAVDRHVLVAPPQSGWMQGSDCIRLRILPDSHVSPTFLSKALLTERHKTWMEAQCSHGATMASLNQEIMRRIPLYVPRKALQRRIAAVLCAFDELIEINERRMELLEDLARSLYREWFVHFRFPGHQNVEFVESELGPIPEGWVVLTVDELAAVVRGSSYRRAELSESEGVPFLNLKCMKRGGGFRRSGLKRYIGRYKATQRAVPRDVLVAVTDMTQERRIVAQAFRMPDLGEPFAVPSLDLALLKPMDEDMRPFLYATLRYSSFSERVRHFANGANVLHLAMDRISEYPIVLPDADVLRRFTMAVNPVLDAAEFLEIHNRQLAATRDLLLPRLVTGRLDISDIDLGVLTPLELE